MKFKVFVPVLAFLIAAPTYAASTKICFGIGELQGDHFVLQLTAKKAVIGSVVGQFDDWLPGTYERDGLVHGRNGVDYISYDLGSNDGANNLLVDKTLLKKGSQGYVKIRNRGEGFGQYNFFCRDAR